MHLRQYCHVEHVHIPELTHSQSYIMEERLQCLADSFCCRHLYIWFGGISRNCVSPQKIVLFLFITLWPHCSSANLINCLRFFSKSYVKLGSAYFDVCNSIKGDFLANKNKHKIRVKLLCFQVEN